MSTDEPKKNMAYKVLGASGLAEDEKCRPEYWFYHYDERFCGPSREAYMEKMAVKCREAAMKNNKQE